jgi:uncharacterized protein YecT (DUF1311 family)
MTLPLILLALATPAGSQAARPATAFAACLGAARAMPAKAQCYAVEQQRLKDDQKKLLDTLFARMKQPGPAGTDYPAAAETLAQSQAAWMTYQEADCQVVRHVSGRGNATGSADGTCVIDHYTARNAVLRDWGKNYLAPAGEGQ